MKFLLAGAAALAFSASATAAISVDGARDAEYGAATFRVAYNPSVAGGFFGGPAVSTSTNTAYDIYGKVSNDTF